MLSSLLFILVLNAAGKSYMGLSGDFGALVTALVTSGFLLVVDGLRLWGGRSTSFGVKRQTPHAWRLKGPIGILGWGLDTGLPVSTVRATSLPGLGVILVATGHAGPFHGLFYGAGIVLGIVAGLVAMGSDERSDRAMDRLIARYRAIGPARMILVPTGLITAVLAISLVSLP